MTHTASTVRMKRRSPFERSTGADRLFDIVIYALLGFAFLITIYPMIVVLSSSFSSAAAVTGGQVWLYPIQPTLKGYQAVFRNSMVLTGYMNSLFYAVAGTLINVTMTVMAAYPLSRKDYTPRGFVMLVFSFTMFFSGGMIPSYILVSKLGIMNTRWAMLLPGAMSVYNMILTRTYFMSALPDELLEAAQLDGCSDFRFIRSVALPLSKPILAVIALYYAVGHWNAYFNAFMYLSDTKLFPLQIVLRSILLLNQVDASTVSMESLIEREAVKNLLKYSLIVIASVPVLALYPFIQKYFIHGVMIGSIKG
ncbi:MAG: carbohydrate ABC transporter permease [Oscillospiraceae bacterium]|nr:carbohydrate ABC transporter permease [Oscillospiraceae bacterium]